MMYHVTMTAKRGTGDVFLEHKFLTPVYGPAARALVEVWTSGALSRTNDPDSTVVTTWARVAA